MKGNHSASKRTALAIIQDERIKCTGGALDVMKASAIRQIELIRKQEADSAMRAILVGFALIRIQASMPGAFTRWLKNDFKEQGYRQSRYFMALCLHFLEQTKAVKPEFLAVPGDQLALSIESAEGCCREFMDQVVEYVGDLSLNELLNREHIKDAKKLGGKREATGEDAPIDPEQLAAQAREELSVWHETGRQLLLTDNLCSRLTRDEIRTFESSLSDMLAQWRRGLKDTLKQSA